MSIRFGTSGWRAVVSEDFTFGNLRRLAHGVSAHVKDHPEFGFSSPDYRAQRKGSAQALEAPLVVVGYDPRFLSEDFAGEVSEVFAADGIRVILSDGETPTPAVAWAVRHWGAVGGVAITASHNAGHYNGFKWTPYWGGPATPAITDDIEGRLGATDHHAVRSMPMEKALREGWVRREDFREPYLKQLKVVLDVPALKRSGLKLGVDAMHGAARGYLRSFLERLGLKAWGLHEERDVLFGGRPPEPSPEALEELRALVLRRRLDLGLACDGDADRFGVLDAGGEWISANDCLGLVLHHLVKNRGLKGRVVRSVMTSHFVDAVAKFHGLEVRETMVGFKYIGEHLRAGGTLLGGEESGGLSIGGHVPEKDGILACLLLAELVAAERAPLSRIRERLFKKVGPFHNVRHNLRLDSLHEARRLQEALRLRPPTVLAGGSVWRIDQTDGFKFIFRDGSWLGLRTSGTEPVFRMYAEASNPKRLEALVEAGKKLLKGKF